VKAAEESCDGGAHKTAGFAYEKAAEYAEGPEKSHLLFLAAKNWRRGGNITGAINILSRVVSGEGDKEFFKRVARYLEGFIGYLRVDGQKLLWHFARQIYVRFDMLREALYAVHREYDLADGPEKLILSLETGRMHKELGEPEKAIGYFWRVLKATSDKDRKEELLVLIAECAVESEAFEEAARVYGRAAKLTGKKHYWLKAVEYCERQVPPAWTGIEIYCLRLIYLESDNKKLKNLWKKVAQACKEQGKWSGAAKAFRSAAKCVEGYRPGGRSERTRLFALARQLDSR